MARAQTVPQTAVPHDGSAGMTRVVVVEDHTLLRQSVAKLVSQEPGFEVVGDCGRGDEALVLIRRTQPHIVLLDVALPGVTGLEVAAQIRDAMPSTRVMFLTMHEDDATVARAVGVGADGYVLKTASMEELITGLRAVAAGGSFLSPSVARNVMARAGGRGGSTGLTHRELEIMQLLADGARPVQVARELFVSVKTVRNHLASIYVKLNVETAAQAIAEAFRRGLVARPG